MTTLLVFMVCDNIWSDIIQPYLLFNKSQNNMYILQSILNYPE